jgi:uncharacterized protein
VLVIDLATRKRLRVNGTVEPAADGGILVRVRQVYWNCPKYIQRRVVDGRPDRSSALPLGGASGGERRGSPDDQRAWVARADTFFIASVHPRGGGDALHRGGAPGFVQLARRRGCGPARVPDYSGNTMFNTLDNLAVHPAAGLLFPDFTSDATLQLTGTTELLWERGQFAAWPGAERAVRFRVGEAIERPESSLRRCRLVEYSPFNPPPPA